MSGRQHGARCCVLGRSWLFGGEAGVDRERYGGDIAGLVGDQPGDRVADIDGFYELDVQEVAHVGAAGGGSTGEQLRHRVVDYHRRVRPGRVHGVDADVVRGQPVRPGTPQAHDGVLAGAVAVRSAAAVAAAANQAERGPGQDDRAAPALLDHDGGSGLNGVPDAEQVDLDLVAERLLLAGVPGHHPDPRVGHHDVHRAEARCAAGHSGLQSGSVADVGLGRNDAPAESLDFSDGPGEVSWRRQRVRDRVDLPADIDRDHVGAVLGQAYRVAAPLSPGRARDERDLTVEPSRHKNRAFLVPGPPPADLRLATAGLYRATGRSLQLYDCSEVRNSSRRPVAVFVSGFKGALLQPKTAWPTHAHAAIREWMLWRTSDK